MDYLKYLVETIHTVVAATVNDLNEPVTCAIDMMHSDENGLYFLTAKGKNFYHRLKEREYIALTGMHGHSTMTRKAISIRGKVREEDEKVLEMLFEKNPYMYSIYPTEQSRKALCAFCLYEGEGEWFDLSVKPIERCSFQIGSCRYDTRYEPKYEITDICIGCRVCEPACPQNCISFDTIPAVIEQEHCLHCGNCMKVCLQQAVIER